MSAVPPEPTPPRSASPTFTELLELERLDRDLYRGVNEPPDQGRTTLFGGQVAAQALKAAGLTVAPDRYPHSLHSYFLRPGMRATPVVYKVERDRDGKSFSARRVSAVQEGEVIFDLTASFQVAEPGGEYSMAPPEVPGPDECTRKKVFGGFPNVSMRIVPPTRVNEMGLEVSGTLWVKIRGGLPDDRLSHCCALAYLSDLGSGFSAIDVPELPSGGPSLDHAMWFRVPIRADEWVLLHMWPVMAGGARGLYSGAMHQLGGPLGAMFSQESLLRFRR